MAQKNKKSRFGNPARAAADAAARGKATVPATQSRLDRAMEALAPGFARWLDIQGRPAQSIDNSLVILDDFFDMYRVSEPRTDPTALVPGAVRDVLETATDANPLAALGLRSGVREYVSYLDQTKLWTGSAEALATVLAELSGSGQILGSLEDDESGQYGEDFEFADIYIRELTQAEIFQSVAMSPLWRNVVALLTWIGEGKDVAGLGAPSEGAAVMVHSGLKVLRAAAQLVTPEEHAAARLVFYWELLSVSGLITIENHRVHVPAETRDSLHDEAFVIQSMRELLGIVIFNAVLAGSQNDELEPWQWETAHWLIQCSSQEELPETAQLLEALANPAAAHPDLLAAAVNVAHWEEEGLVTVGHLVEVPPAYRPDIYDVLCTDFPIRAVGPGAATAFL